MESEEMTFKTVFFVYIDILINIISICTNHNVSR